MKIGRWYKQKILYLQENWWLNTGHQHVLYMPWACMCIVCAHASVCSSRGILNKKRWSYFIECFLPRYSLEHSPFLIHPSHYQSQKWEFQLRKKPGILKKKKKYPSSCASETWKVSFKPAMPNKENNPFWVIIGNVSGSRMSSYGWRRIHIPFKSLHLTLNSEPSRDVLCLVCKRETTYSFWPGQLRPVEWQKCLCLVVIARLNKNWLQKKSYQPNLSL